MGYGTTVYETETSSGHRTSVIFSGERVILDAYDGIGGVWLNMDLQAATELSKALADAVQAAKDNQTKDKGGMDEHV